MLQVRPYGRQASLDGRGGLKYAYFHYMGVQQAAGGKLGLPADGGKLPADAGKPSAEGGGARADGGKLVQPADGGKLRLEAQIAPDWAAIDPLREAIGRLVGVLLGDEESDAVAMVSCELLENAVKFGRRGAASVGLSIAHRDGAVVVRVTNAVDEVSADLAALKKHLAWLRTFADPADAYMMLLGSAFDGAGDAGNAGKLGLARIASEGKCVLSWESDGPGRITVSAVRPLGPCT